MDNNNGKLLLILLIIGIILIMMIGVIMFVQKTENDRQIADLNNNQNKMQETTNNLKENILLYEGSEILNKIGTQFIDLTEMEISEEARRKYNTTYFNYENGKYLGEILGYFGEETYEGFSIVTNVKRIAMTQKYNAIPREYKLIEKLPEKLNDMADYSSVAINEIDLDGDGKSEYIVCYTVNYKKGQIGDGESQATSGIMLFDNNYKKIADLVTLENGFWGNIKEENYKRFLSLQDTEYIDIDNDGIMEIIIEIPTYEGTKISILRYSNNKVEGEINLQASVMP